MLFSQLSSIQLSLFFIQYVLSAAPPLTQTITDDGNGKSIYVPLPGSTSSVAAPAYTPTLVYNCEQMPLICENVAAWAKTNGNPQGDIPANNLILYFDPDQTNKNARRQMACGCFDHDSCVGSGTSNGKRSGDKVTDIATSAGPFTNMPATATAIMLAGPNPPPNGNRQPLNSVPGRFFAFGIGMTCDEFPAAPFIEGGNNAETICALQSWQVYQGKATSQNTQGKWPLTPQEGKRSEQDWQAQAHIYLRQAFGIQNRKNPIGLGTVWPFSFTTTSDSAGSTSKAWVVVSGPSTSVITKRNLPPVTVAVPTATTLAVTGDERLDARALENFEPRAPEAEPNIATGPFLAVRTASPEPKPRNFGPLKARANAPPMPAAECTIDFDIQGLEDIDDGDPGFDDLLPQYQSKPICGTGLSSVDDVQATDTYLDNEGNDWDYGNCCGGGLGDSCGPILVSNGTASVSLCGDTEQCVGCAQLGNYVEGILGACQLDGFANGVQVLNEVDGLNISVAFVADT